MILNKFLVNIVINYILVSLCSTLFYGYVQLYTPDGDIDNLVVCLSRTSFDLIKL